MEDEEIEREINGGDCGREVGTLNEWLLGKGLEEEKEDEEDDDEEEEEDDDEEEEGEDEGGKRH